VPSNCSWWAWSGHVLPVPTGFPQSRNGPLGLSSALRPAVRASRLSPLPWQWTGTTGPARSWAGFIQAPPSTWSGWPGAVQPAPAGRAAGTPAAHAVSVHAAAHAVPVHAAGRARPAFGFGVALGLVNLAFGIAFGWVCAAKEATEASGQRTADLLRQPRPGPAEPAGAPRPLQRLERPGRAGARGPLAAEEMIAGLADLYRMLTVHGDAALISLEQERRLVEGLPGHGADAAGGAAPGHLAVAGLGRRAAAAALLPDAMVENAIKHGISPAEAAGRW